MLSSSHSSFCMVIKHFYLVLMIWFQRGSWVRAAGTRSYHLYSNHLANHLVLSSSWEGKMTAFLNWAKSHEISWHFCHWHNAAKMLFILGHVLKVMSWISLWRPSKLFIVSRKLSEYSFLIENIQHYPFTVSLPITYDFPMCDKNSQRKPSLRMFFSQQKTQSWFQKGINVIIS